MTKVVKTDEELRMLLQHAANHQTQRRLAYEAGISEGYLSDILRGNRRIPARLASLVGYKKGETLWENTSE